MTINGMKFELVPVNLASIARLELMGIHLADAADKPVAFCVGMVALSAGLTFEQAADAIQQHINDGGDVCELLDAVTAAVENADTRGL